MDRAHLERRWTLPRKPQNSSQSKAGAEPYPSGSTAQSRRSGGSSKRPWSKVHRWRGWRCRMESTPTRVLGWRKLCLAGRLGSASRAIKLLPVHVSGNSPSLAPTTHRECSPSVELAKSTPGTIHVELRHAQVRIEGSADPALLRVLLECLRR